MVITRGDYTADAVEAARGVLLELSRPEERARLQRDAFERVNALIASLKDSF